MLLSLFVWSYIFSGLSLLAFNLLALFSSGFSIKIGIDTYSMVIVVTLISLAPFMNVFVLIGFINRIWEVPGYRRATKFFNVPLHR